MFEHLAEGFPVGMRFHSAPVVRVADAKPVHLGHAARADGAWRLYVFADRRPTAGSSHVRELCEFLESDASPITRFTPAGADPDSVIDVRAVFQQGHRDLDVDAMPPVLLPQEGRLRPRRLREGVLPRPAGRGHLRPARCQPRDGCIVVVRPDQYVAHVLPLHGHEALTESSPASSSTRSRGDHHERHRPRRHTAQDAGRRRTVAWVVTLSFFGLVFFDGPRGLRQGLPARRSSAIPTRWSGHPRAGRGAGQLWGTADRGPTARRAGRRSARAGRVRRAVQRRVPVAGRPAGVDERDGSACSSTRSTPGCPS